MQPTKDVIKQAWKNLIEEFGHNASREIKNSLFFIVVQFVRYAPDDREFPDPLTKICLDNLQKAHEFFDDLENLMKSGKEVSNA